VSILLSAVAAATFALSGPSGAVAVPCPPLQSSVDASTRATPIIKLQPDASSWEQGVEGEVRFRVTVPTAEAPTPVNVRLHWAADRATNVNNGAWDRDEDFIRGAQR
jgi:hypothetical protein